MAGPATGSPTPPTKPHGKLSGWIDTHKGVALGLVVVVLGVLYLVSRGTGSSSTTASTAASVPDASTAGVTDGSGYDSTSDDSGTFGQIMSLLSDQQTAIQGIGADQATQDATLAGLTSSASAQTSGLTALQAATAGLSGQVGDVSNQIAANQQQATGLLGVLGGGEQVISGQLTGIAAAVAATPSQTTQQVVPAVTQSLGTVMAGIQSSPAQAAKPSTTANNAKYTSAIANLSKALGHPVTTAYLKTITTHPVNDAYVEGIGSSPASAAQFAASLKKGKKT